MKDQMFTFKGNWEAPRWMGVESAIKSTALVLDLECKTQVMKGFLCETGVFKVSGDRDSVARFKGWFSQISQ